MSRLFNNVSRLKGHMFLSSIVRRTKAYNHSIIHIRYLCHQTVRCVPQVKHNDPESICCYSTGRGSSPPPDDDFKISDFFPEANTHSVVTQVAPRPARTKRSRAHTAPSPATKAASRAMNELIHSVVNRVAVSPANTTPSHANIAPSHAMNAQSPANIASSRATNAPSHASTEASDRVFVSSQLESGLAELEQLLRSYSSQSLPRFLELMKIARETDSISRQQAASLMSSTMHHNLLLAGDRCQTLKDLWQLFKTKGVPLDLTLFNEKYTQLHFVNALSSLSVDDERVEMAENNVCPDYVSYALFLKIFCESGDMAAANRLLQEMTEHGMQRSIIHYNDLIRGHFIAGNAETAIQMANTVDDSNLKANTFTKGELFVGLARIGEYDKLKEMIRGKTSFEMPNRYFGQALEILVDKGHIEVARELLQLFAGQYVDVYSGDLLTSFLSKGLYELAILLHGRMKFGTPQKFVLCAICSTINADDFAYCMRQLMNGDLRDDDIWDIYFRAAYMFPHKPDRLVVCLDMVKRLGIEVKSHAYFPAAVGYCKSGDLEGIVAIMPELFPVECVDMKDSVDLLVHHIGKLGKPLNEIVALLQKHAPIEVKPYINFLLIIELLQQLYIEKAIQFANGENNLAADKLLKVHFLACLFKYYIPHKLDEVFTLLAAMCKQVDLPLDQFYRSTINRLIKDDIDMEWLLHCIYVNDMAYTLNPYAINTITPYISMEMKNKLHFLLQSNTRYKQVLKPREYRGGELFKDLEEHVDAMRVDKVSEIEGHLEHTGMSVTSARIAKKLADFHVDITKNANKAFHYYVKSFANPREEGTDGCITGYRPGRFLPMKIAMLFAEHHDFDNAIRVLRSGEVFRHRQQKAPGLDDEIDQYHSNWKRLIQLCDNYADMCTILQLGLQNGFLHNASDRETVWKSFFQTVAKRCSTGEMTRTIVFAYKNCESDSFITTVNAFLVTLIQEDQEEVLSHILPTLKDYLSWFVEGKCEHAIEHIKVLAFMEAGQTPVALKIAQDPDFVADMKLVWQYYDYCLRINEPDLMVKLYDILKHCKNIKKDELLFICMKAYCNASPPQTQMAREVFEVKYMKEEVKPSDKSRAYYYRNVKDKYSQPYWKR